jgi:hypothetical protein
VDGRARSATAPSVDRVEPTPIHDKELIMSTTEVRETNRTGAVRAFPAALVAVCVAFPLTAALTAEHRGMPSPNHLADIVAIVVIGALAAGLAFGLAPWALAGGPARARRTAVTLAAVGLVTMVPAFWTMIPVAAGATACVIAYASADAARRVWTIVAIGGGALAATASLVAYLMTS